MSWLKSQSGPRYFRVFVRDFRKLSCSCPFHNGSTVVNNIISLSLATKLGCLIFTFPRKIKHQEFFELRILRNSVSKKKLNYFNDIYWSVNTLTVLNWILIFMRERSEWFTHQRHEKNARRKKQFFHDTGPKFYIFWRVEFFK